MSACQDEALRRQRAWAASAGHRIDSAGYLARVEDNLIHPMSASALRAFTKGAGGELMDKEHMPAKMRALHSSSALAVNVFDFWSTRDRRPLEGAFSLPHGSVALEFEAEQRTGLRGTPPTLDVLVRYPDRSVIGIESKFTEWMVKKPRSKAPFSTSYFPEGSRLWSDLHLPRCQALAELIHSRRVRFDYLDAPQLLKHALGLAHSSQRATLLYCFCDCPGEESQLHADELARFEEAIATELSFRGFSYRGPLEALRKSEDSTTREYAEWNLNRYIFPPPDSDACC